jgi:hypothetical protein
MYNDDEERLECGHTESEHAKMLAELLGGGSPLSLNGMQRRLVEKAAEIFERIASENDSNTDPHDLEFTLKATKPSEPLEITCTRINRRTRDVISVYEVTTMPNVIGNTEVVMQLIGAICTGLAEQELAQEAIDNFSA